jgi:hypothetical protein
MEVSFIRGGNRSTWRKLLTFRKSLTNLITTQVVLGNDCRNSYQSYNHTIRTTTATVVIGSSCLYIENENL